MSQPHDLLRLTAIPNPEVDGGRPAEVYLSPWAIVSVTRTMGAVARTRLPWYRKIFRRGRPIFTDYAACTQVIDGAGRVLLVVEPPAEVIEARRQLIFAALPTVGGEQ